jgi:hypothetical protein
MSWHPLALLPLNLVALALALVWLYQQTMKSVSSLRLGVVIAITSFIAGVLTEYIYVRRGGIGGIMSSQPLHDNTVDPVAAWAFAGFFAIVVGLISGFIMRLIAEGFSLRHLELLPIGVPLGSGVGYIVTPSLSGVILCGIVAGFAWMTIWLAPFGVSEPDVSELPPFPFGPDQKEG